MHLTKTHQMIVGQLVAGLVTLVATILAARSCGPKVTAESLSTILIMSVLLDFIDFGACSWSARELAARKMSSNMYFQIMVSRLVVAFLTAPIIIILSVSFSSLPYELIPLGLYPILWIATNYIQQFLLINDHVLFAQALQTIERLCWLFVLPFIYLNFDEYYAFSFPILIGLLLHALLGLFLIKREYFVRFQRPKLKIQYLRESRYFGGLGVVTDIGNLDTPIVTALAPFNEAGSYSVSQRFRNPTQLPFQAIAVRIRNFAAKSDQEGVVKYLKSERTLIFFAILSLVVMSIVSAMYANHLFGNSFSNLNQILSFSFLSAIPSGLNFIASAILTGFGFERYVMTHMTVAVSINIFGCLFFASQFNAIHVVLFLFISNWFSFALFARKIRWNLQ